MQKHIASDREINQQLSYVQLRLYWAALITDIICWASTEDGSATTWTPTGLIL